MANSPVLFGPNNTAINLQGAELLSSGVLLNNAGAKNYITNSTFANGLLTGYQLGTTGTLTNGLPTGTPTIGSGTTATTISVVSGGAISALNGGNALSVASTGTATVGNGVFIGPLAIDAEDRAQVLSFKTSYVAGGSSILLSGTLQNTVAVAFWDATNSVWLSSAGNFNFVQSTGVGHCTATMQTGVTTASVYAVIYYPATSTAPSFTYGSLFLGPQITAQAPAMTDWVAYTPTIMGFGTPTNVVAFSRRNGSDLEGYISFTSGTSTAVLAQITYGFQGGNGNVQADSSKWSANNNNIIGAIGYGASSASSFVPIGTQTTTNYFQIGVQSSSTAGLTAGNGSSIAASGTAVSIEFQVPIVGWSANTASSADSDTRVIATSVYTLTSTTATANTNLAYTTSAYDTAGAMTLATGSFKVPVSGYYRCVIQGMLGSAATQVNLVNSRTGGMAAGFISTTVRTNCTATMLCAAGDLLSFQTTGSITWADTIAYAYFERLSGPAVVQAVESVNARYYTTAGNSVSTTATAITYGTKSFDTHNAYNASTGVYTVPVSGKYLVTASVYYTSGQAWTSTVKDILLYKNGGNYSYFSLYFPPAAYTGPLGQTGSDTIQCNAGDTLAIYLQHNEGAAKTLDTTLGANMFSITRIGN